MLRPSLVSLKSWAESNRVILNGVEPQPSKTFNGGTGVLATKDIEGQVEDNEEPITLIRVPSDMVLSIGSVNEIAKTTPILSTILKGLGEAGMYPRTPILAYQLLLCCFPDQFKDTKCETHDVWSSYLPYLPSENPLPTAWTEKYQQAVMPTTLGSALQAKLSRLSDEWDEMRAHFSSAGLFESQSSGTDPFSLETWFWLDAMYRSRGLEMLDQKCCLVPVIDMANHASGKGSNCAYQIDSNGDIILVLDRDTNLSKDDEIFISYGDDKGSCEMLFSYGFLEPKADATSLLLTLSDPDDDPLFLAKKIAFDVAPGVRLTRLQTSPEIRWTGEFVWLFCVNEEDGLDFEVVNNDGKKRVQALWKGDQVKNIDDLVERLHDDQWAKVFTLRADEFVAMRIRNELEVRRQHARNTKEKTEDEVMAQINLLAKQELALLEECLDQLEMKSAYMADDEVIVNWLQRHNERYDAPEEQPETYEAEES